MATGGFGEADETAPGPLEAAWRKGHPARLAKMAPSVSVPAPGTLAALARHMSCTLEAAGPSLAQPCRWAATAAAPPPPAGCPAVRSPVAGEAAGCGRLCKPRVMREALQVGSDAGQVGLDGSQALAAPLPRTKEWKRESCQIAHSMARTRPPLGCRHRRAAAQQRSVRGTQTHLPWRPPFLPCCLPSTQLGPGQP